MFARVIQSISGAKRGEQLSVFLSFLALLFLLTSYYLVKPLRESRFLLHFNADSLAYFMLVTPILAFVVTKFFSFWVGRIPRYRLMVITFGIVMLCKLAFFILLPISGRWASGLYFFWASVYFTLVLSILWAVFNTLFKAEQAERCFGFVALGATMGSISGSKISSWLAVSAFKDWALIVALFTMLVSLVLTLWNIKITEAKQIDPGSENTSHTEVGRGWDDVTQVLTNPYVKGIAIMVFGLAFVGTMVNLQVYPQIDQGIAQRAYKQTFAEIDPPETHLDLVMSLKKLNPEERQERFESQWPEAQSADLMQIYTQYMDSFESLTRQFFSTVNFYQGLLGVFLLVVVARFLFKFVGLRFTVLILPVIFLAASVFLMFPMELVVLQALLIVGGAANYSLNNATKELLYTPTSEAVRFQQKPLIEGPVMRVGDVSASLIKILVTSVLAGSLALPALLQGRLLLAAALGVTIFWIVLIWRTGGRYDKAQKAGKLNQDLDHDA